MDKKSASVRFKLELPEGYKDPGDFTRLRIQVPGEPEFVLDNQDGWIEYDTKFQPSSVYDRLRKRNLSQSKYVLVLRGSARAGDPPLVLLRSWGYASNAERLHVIGFQPAGQPVLLLNTDLNLVDLIDLDGDGSSEIVGRPCMSEELGDGLETYAPFRVFSIPQPTGASARVSLPLSKAYNLDHHYGWAGPDCDGKLAVIFHPPSGGDPVVLKVDDARKLIGSTRK